jgi:hypothetical protein
MSLGCLTTLYQLIRHRYAASNKSTAIRRTSWCNAWYSGGPGLEPSVEIKVTLKTGFIDRLNN